MAQQDLLMYCIWSVYIMNCAYIILVQLLGVGLFAFVLIFLTSCLVFLIF